MSNAPKKTSRVINVAQKIEECRSQLYLCGWVSVGYKLNTFFFVACWVEEWFFCPDPSRVRSIAYLGLGLFSALFVLSLKQKRQELSVQIKTLERKRKLRTE